jgi:hypothetical protein
MQVPYCARGTKATSASIMSRCGHRKTDSTCKRTVLLPVDAISGRRLQVCAAFISTESDRQIYIAL